MYFNHTLSPLIPTPPCLHHQAPSLFYVFSFLTYWVQLVLATHTWWGTGPAPETWTMYQRLHHWRDPTAPPLSSHPLSIAPLLRVVFTTPPLPCRHADWLAVGKVLGRASELLSEVTLSSPGDIFWVLPKWDSLATPLIGPLAPTPIKIPSYHWILILSMLSSCHPFLLKEHLPHAATCSIIYLLLFISFHGHTNYMEHYRNITLLTGVSPKLMTVKFYVELKTGLISNNYMITQIA